MYRTSLTLVRSNLLGLVFDLFLLVETFQTERWTLSDLSNELKVFVLKASVKQKKNIRQRIVIERRIKYLLFGFFYSSQDTGFILFQLKQNPFPNNLTPEIVLREFMWLLAWKMFFTTDKIFTQHKNGRLGSGVKTTKILGIAWFP